MTVIQNSEEPTDFPHISIRVHSKQRKKNPKSIKNIENCS